MRTKANEKVLLAVMKPGDQGEVLSFLHPEYPAMRRLAALGFLPGERFILERCRPGYLIRFGYTRLAMNRVLAREILVCKMEASFGYRRQVP